MSTPNLSLPQTVDYPDLNQYDIFSIRCLPARDHMCHLRFKVHQFMAQGFHLSSEGGKDASSEIRVSGTEDS